MASPPRGLGAAQVVGQEAEVVEGEDAAVQPLLLVRQDGGDLLRELDQVTQVRQLLTDARHAGREGADGACHAAAQLAFWERGQTERLERHVKRQS